MANDILDYNTAWQEVRSGWSRFDIEAEKDTRAYMGDQWSDEFRQYLRREKRSEAVYNKIKRVVNFISGYERRNRLSLIAKPRGLSDDKLANQQTAIMLNIMSNYGGYGTCSEAFKMGTCVSGLNLVEVFIDTEGNVGFHRDPYNQAYLDPLWTKPDLSDCGYIVRERAVSKEQAILFFPDKIKDIQMLSTGITTNRFTGVNHTNNTFNKNSIVYGEFHRQTLKNILFVFDHETGIDKEFTGTEQEQQVVASDPFLSQRFIFHNKIVKSMRVQIFLQDQLFYDGPDRYGIEEYRFTPIFGDYTPELRDDKYKLQAITRSIRDPQIEFNKRMSQQSDIFESQINSGWVAENGKVIDPESLFGSGQSKVIIVKGMSDDNPAGVNAVRKIEAASIPAGMDQFSNTQGSLIDQLAGTNDELLGSDNKDIPGILSRLRTGAALTTLHSYFDNYRFAKRRIGKLIIQIVQKNYQQAKIEEMLEEPLHPDFYNSKILDNDISVQEGIHTDSQREMAYSEFISLKERGIIDIPSDVIMSVLPVQLKETLMNSIKQRAEGQQQAQAEQAQIEKQQLFINAQLVQAETQKVLAEVQKIAADIQKSRTESIENLAEAELDIAKADDIKKHGTRHGNQVERQQRKPRHSKNRQKAELI